MAFGSGGRNSWSTEEMRRNEYKQRAEAEDAGNDEHLDYNYTHSGLSRYRFPLVFFGVMGVVFLLTYDLIGKLSTTAIISVAAGIAASVAVEVIIKKVHDEW